MCTLHLFPSSGKYHPYICALLIAAVCVVGGLLYVGDWASSESPGEEASPAGQEAAVEPVNQVLGDASYVATFGRFPSRATPDKVRLQTHLSYVERMLRARPADHLTFAQQQRRARALDHLRAYWQTGIFPRNTTHQGERTPVFIDAEGRICAVGYLIGRTIGQDMAEHINRRYKYASIQSMNMPGIDRWAQKHGFSIRELAMIQPAYGSPQPEEPEKVNKAVEGGLIGLSAAATGVNSFMIAQSRRSLLSAGAGFIAGGLTLGVGLSDRANFSAADITTASIAVVASGWNLLQPLYDRTTLSQSSAALPRVQPAAISTPDGRSEMGIHLSWSL